MPELPEVETVRRQLEPALVGKRIKSASVLDERLTRPEPPRSVERAVAGRAVTAVARRGKYLLIGLEGGRTLALHLRMTGNLLLRGAGGDGETADLMKTEPTGGPRRFESAAEPNYVRARFQLDDGEELLFTDLRRFGQAIVLDEGDALEDYFAARLGVEPLSKELTGERLLELAKDRKAPLKSFLLSQSRVAGIGNIYADEALWRARLHPLSPAGSMKLEHAERLVKGIVDALEAGLEHGGASIDDYVDTRGEQGSMQEEFLVHTREGEECLRGDGGEIQRIVVSGRSTYFCPACQERLRRRPRRRVKAK
ncbi:MAG: bifunctional DNA-formamidopyrimidine glycosylase/DNA-(apurinic or apyrimidinic site) lyase [Solirubrobacterales bacterium]